MGAKHEVVVIGGGHNGLTVAGYLAKAGVDVCVIESLPYVGGGVISPEVAAPGFKTDLCSIWHGFIQANPLIRDDELGLHESQANHEVIAFELLERRVDAPAVRAFLARINDATAWLYLKGDTAALPVARVLEPVRG